MTRLFEPRALRAPRRLLRLPNSVHRHLLRRLDLSRYGTVPVAAGPLWGNVASGVADVLRAGGRVAHRRCRLYFPSRRRRQRDRFDREKVARERPSGLGAQELGPGRSAAPGRRPQSVAA